MQVKMEIVGGGTAVGSRPRGTELPTSSPCPQGLTMQTRLELFCPDKA